MIWFRIDNRLVHGQIVEAWLPYLSATTIVVANDEMAANPLCQQIIMLAIPRRVRTFFKPVAELKSFLAALELEGEDTLVLFKDCTSLQQAVESGLEVSICNIGNIHYSAGKTQICQHVALSTEEYACLKSLTGNGMTLDFRSIPVDKPILKNW